MNDLANLSPAAAMVYGALYSQLGCSPFQKLPKTDLSAFQSKLPQLPLGVRLTDVLHELVTREFLTFHVTSFEGSYYTVSELVRRKCPMDLAMLYQWEAIIPDTKALEDLRRAVKAQIRKEERRKTEEKDVPE